MVHLIGGYAEGVLSSYEASANVTARHKRIKGSGYKTGSDGSLTLSTSQ